MIGCGGEFRAEVTMTPAATKNVPRFLIVRKLRLNFLNLVG